MTQGVGGLQATHVPVLVLPDPLRVRGHVARANQQAGPGDLAQDALIILQGPQAYVSPSLYPSKARHGQVVPTWNYEAVHLSGRLEWFTDAGRLLALVEAQTARFEAGRPEPWAVSDAPQAYVDQMLGAITGFEMVVDRFEAARKLSQNRTAEDRAGVLAALSASPLGADRAVAAVMRP